MLFLLSRLKHNRQPAPRVGIDKNRALVYGLLLGIGSAIGVFIVMTWLPQTNWAWLTLTLYVLANPAKDFDWLKMRDRLLGTLGGFVVVTVIFLLTDSQAVIYTLAAITAWMTLSAMAIGLPYWAYVIVLTPTVVMVTATSTNRELFADQRLEYTILGIGLTIIVAGLAHLILRDPKDVLTPQLVED